MCRLAVILGASAIHASFVAMPAYARTGPIYVQTGQTDARTGKTDAQAGPVYPQALGASAIDNFYAQLELDEGAACASSMECDGYNLTFRECHSDGQNCRCSQQEFLFHPLCADGKQGPMSIPGVPPEWYPPQREPIPMPGNPPEGFFPPEP